MGQKRQRQRYRRRWIEQQLSRVDFCGSQRHCRRGEAIECESCRNATCVARIVSKVSKLISGKEEATAAAAAEQARPSSWTLWRIIAQGQTEMGNSCQQATAAPRTACSHSTLSTHFIFFCYKYLHGMRCACVRENFPRFLPDGVNQTRRGARAGAELEAARCICFEGKTVKGIWQDFQLCSGYRGPSTLHPPCSSFHSPPCSTFCLLHSTRYLQDLAAFYHKVKVTFWKSAQKGNHIHTHWAALTPHSLSLSVSLISSLSLSHTCKYF